MRSATLCAALRAQDDRVTVVTRGLPAWVQERFDAVGCTTMASDSPNLDDVDGPDVWIVDGYTLGAELEQLIAMGHTVVAIDDNHELPVGGAALVLNQNLHATPALYPDVAAERLLLGSEYALIRVDVCELDRPPCLGSAASAARLRRHRPRRLTLPVASGLAPWAASRSSLRSQRTIPTVPRSVRLPAFVSMVATCAMGSVSRTSPSSVVGRRCGRWESSGSRRLRLSWLTTRSTGLRPQPGGFVESVDARGADFDVDTLVERVAALLVDVDRRTAMANAGRGLFDGGGPRRVAAAVAALG